MLDSLLSIIKAELKLIFSSKSIISVFFLGPLIYSIIYPQPYLPEILRDLPIAVIDQDNSAPSRALIRNIDATDSIKVAVHVDTMQEAKRLIQQEKVYGILIIPFNFAKNITAGRSSPIAFYGNASYILIYNNIATALNNVVTATNSQISVTRQIAQGLDPVLAKSNSVPFTPDMIALFNPQSGYATYVLPASFILILHQILFVSILLASVLTLKSRETQLAELGKKHSRIVASTILSIGRIVAYISIYVLVFGLYILLLHYVYGLPDLATNGTLLIFALVFLISTAAFALAVSTLFTKIDEVFLLVVPMSMILFFMSGISWPKELIPEFLRGIAHALPATIAMIGLTKITQMGTPLNLMLFELGNFAVLALIYLSLHIGHHYFVLKQINRKR